MPIPRHHRETHVQGRTAWLRASVLGANDGIVSTASLLLGVAAAGTERTAILTAGLAALVAGAGSMAVGEYISVSSQRDAEQADIRKEVRELATVPERELEELAEIYVAKGLSADLALEVAVQLTERDALAAHLVEELGITPENSARPIMAAASSAAAFTVGAILPIVAIVGAPDGARIPVTLVVALVALALLGFTAARVAGAATGRAVLRVVVGSGAAMALTMAVGAAIGGAGV